MKKSAQKDNADTKNSYSEKEMKRYLGAMTETHNEHLKGIREGFQIINRKLDGHTEILGEHTKILGEHSRILNSHAEMLGSIMEDVSILKDDMQIVKKELKKKVDYDEFLALVQRVNKLEKA